MLLASFWMIIYGIVRAPLLLGIALLLVLMPLPAVTTMLTSIIQVKTPPDLQGRVFALLVQGAQFLKPISYLMVGLLVDQVLEPAVGRKGWQIVAPLVGSQTGSGMGLLLVIAGGLLMLITAVMYALPQLRHLETDLPDYAPTAVVTPQPASAPLVRRRSADTRA